jgi:hypothetical protein
MQGPWDTGTWDDALWDSLPVTGNAATGSVGNLGVAVAVALSGVAGTGAVGTVSPTHTIAITGVQATGEVGNQSVNVTIAISGVAATGDTGNVTPVVPPIIIIDDTHDGDYKKKKYAEERATKERRKAELVNLYERIVEGRPEVAEKIVAPFVKTKAQGQQTAPLVRQIDFDKLMRDITRVEALYKEHLEMDDEEVLSLL